MRILVVFCHPSEDSFAAHMLSVLTDRLRRVGHDCIIRDLYADRFDPVLTSEEWSQYERLVERNISLKRYTDDLAGCEGLLLVFPSWWYGMPAMMKGYLDRVWVPGIAFGFNPDRTVDTIALRHITRFVVVTTYGAPWKWIRLYLRDPVRMAVLRGLRRLFSPKCRTSWFALYNMDRNSHSARTMFLRKVTRGMKIFGE
jgi:NAD(P)H dehydrogenase (quinone)